MTQSYTAAPSMPAPFDPAITHIPRKKRYVFLSVLGFLFIICGTLFAAIRAERFKRPELPIIVIPLAWPDDATTTSSTHNVTKVQGLAQVPDPRLIEIIPEGILPARSPDGATPLAVYARPSAPLLEPKTSFPMVAIVMRRAGIGQLVTSEAMLRLPPEVTFAMSPYAGEADRQAIEIRDEGHELFLDLPIAEPMSVTDDPGPKALSVALNDQDNHIRLRWLMTRFPGYAGLLGHLGGDGMMPNSLRKLIMHEVEGRGLGLIESGPVQETSEKNNIYRAPVNIALGNDLAPDEFDAALSQLEVIARKTGFALGVADITPLAIERVKRWSSQIADKGVHLVPASALLTREPRS